jgi:predicted dehydrogenase
MKPLGMAVVGAGYWGPNLIRNFLACTDTDLRWVCDLDEQAARRAIGRRSTVRTTTELEAVLSDRDVVGVAVATPVRTHAEVALACLEAGKHVMVEKPLAMSAAEGEKLLAVADRAGLTLMSDHTYCYTSAVRKIREIIRAGELGDVHYVDSVRINLGLVQSEVDVFWDLAPHDLSILDFVLPEDERPTSVAAHGADPVGAGHACVGYLTLPLSGDAIAHVNVNWLSPVKVRNTIIGGSRRIIVWDDLHPSQRLSVYDSGVRLNGRLDPETRRDVLVSYRTGDMVAPALTETEALGGVIREFAAAIREGRPAATDGAAGLRVLKILEAASASLVRGGALVPVEGPR